MEKTLAIIKPDAIERGIAGKILQKLEGNQLKIVAMKMVSLDKEQAEAFYQVHADRPFFGSLTSYMSSGPIIAYPYEGAVTLSPLDLLPDYIHEGLRYSKLSKEESDVSA